MAGAPFKYLPLWQASCCSRLKGKWKETPRRLGTPETEMQVAPPWGSLHLLTGTGGPTLIPTHPATFLSAKVADDGLCHSQQVPDRCTPRSSVPVPGVAAGQVTHI